MNGTQHEASTREIDLHRLESEFNGVFSNDTIKLVVNTVFDDLEASSAVTVFLPLLVERFAREQLRSQASQQKLQGSTEASSI